MNRPALIKMIHLGARRLGWDDDTRHAWMKKHTTQSSCALCNDAELSRLVDELRRLGALDRPGVSYALPGGSGPDRPTPEQWRYILDLSRKLGMTGTADDPALRTFCRKVAKVDELRFLDQAGVNALILGLENWLQSRRKKAGGQG
jgi:hypothetical protein